ncbi:MAG: type I restriction enzyme HsdR N-terminal domain-containing protein [Selenomonadaceae bacterium]|nr:type I restriction enzyme HsdR N-terminal domain-containing protein [Selenomonadaceae bacterium]
MFIRKLIDDYGYKISQIDVERPIQFGLEVKRADIVIRILAVVGLHGNVFKSHTRTKTSVLFVQKWAMALT